MLKSHSLFLLITLLGLSSIIQAKSALTQHAINVSQSMSAFYMYNLTEGDERYKADYENFLSLADANLEDYEKEDVMGATDIKNQWSKLRPLLNYDSFQGSDYFVPGPIRIQYRTYLNKLYQKIVSLYTSENGLAQKLALMEFNIEVISARFYDISSSLYGGQSITSEDSIIDPKKISSKFKHDLTTMKNSPEATPFRKQLNLIEGKWNFIEEGVIDYEAQSAYLLVYYNKRKINKLFNSSEKILMAGR